MNEQLLLQKLASAGRGDAPPLIDIRGGILDAIAEAHRPSNVLLWVFTAATTAAAAVVAIAAMLHPAAAVPSDPFGDIMRIVSPVM